MLTDSDSIVQLPFTFVDHSTKPVDALAIDIISLEKPNPSDLSNITIWCESRSVIHTIKLQILAAAKSRNIKGILFPNIISLQDWVWQQKSPVKPLIGEINKQLLLVEAIRQSPGLFQTNNAWPLAKELVGLFNECTLAQVPLANGEQALRETLSNSYGYTLSSTENISRESEIVYQLWQAYRDQINAREWIDPIDHYSQWLLQNNKFDTDHRYYMIGHHRIALAESIFLQRLASHSNFTIYTPNISKHESGLAHHPHHNWSITDSHASIDSNSRELALNLIYNNSSHVFKRIETFKEKFKKEVFQSWLSLYTCTSTEQHVHAVCMQAKKWQLENRCPVGIIINDRLLARRIRAVLEEEGISPSDLGGWTLSTTSAATSIEILLDAIELNFKKDCLLDLLSSPFLPDNQSNNSSYNQQLNAAKRILNNRRNSPTDNIDSFIHIISK